MQTMSSNKQASRHTRVVHSGIRPFPCEHCSFRGGQAYDLVRHTKTMHPMVPTVPNDKFPRIYVFLVSDDSVQHFSVIWAVHTLQSADTRMVGQDGRVMVHWAVLVRWPFWRGLLGEGERGPVTVILPGLDMAGLWGSWSWGGNVRAWGSILSTWL